MPNSPKGNTCGRWALSTLACWRKLCKVDKESEGSPKLNIPYFAIAKPMIITKLVQNQMAGRIDLCYGLLGVHILYYSCFHKRERFSFHNWGRKLSEMWLIWLINLGEATEHAWLGATWVLSLSCQASACSNLPSSIQKVSIPASEAGGCPDACDQDGKYA